MRRGSSLLRNRVAITLLFLVAITTASTDNLWSVHIDNDPAPPVADSPPFSRHASRDRALLKYQIPGIVGGYIGFVLILGVAILTFGRRMRRAAQSSRGTLSMEMVRPAHKSLDPSPISPAQSFKKRWGNLRNASIDGVKKGSSSTKSPLVHSVATFDVKVLEADRARQQEEMQNLYAVVMAQDAVAPKTFTAREQQPDPTITPLHQPYTSNSLSTTGVTVQQPRVYDEKHPPELAHLNHTVEALYPPYAPMPSDPASRTTSTVPTTTSALSYNSRAPLISQANLSSSPPHDHGHFLQDSRGSPVRNLRRSSLRISTMHNTSESVQQSHGQAQSPADFSASPISPVHARRPTTPYPHGFVPHMEENDEDTDDGDHHPTSANDINSSYPYAFSPRAIPPSAPQRLSPPPARRTSNTIDSDTTRQHITANSSLRSLPLRTFSPATTISPNPTPTPTRTTFLSPRQDRLAHFHTHLSPSQQLANPSSATTTTAANAPSFARMVAAGLTTPYSAYMPFSPVTPVTPGLRSREQRRREEREEERRVPCREDDAVVPEKEMWGDAW